MTRTDRFAIKVVAVTLLAWAVLPAATAAAAKKCAGKRATIVGTNDRDVLRGKAGNDVIVGLAKGDRIFGKGGDDSLCGGGGSDRLAGGDGNDVLLGAGGFDVLIGGSGDDRLKGGGRDDYADGGEGNDQVLGGPGDDYLLGGPGDDHVDGGAGPFDLVSFERSPVGVTVDMDVTTPQVTGEGTDTVLGSEGIFGSAHDDTLLGQNAPSPAGNGLFGLSGDDVLDARDGDDFVAGDDGDDDLDGGPGDDFLDGGPSTTGPPQGDKGDGGTHVIGDQCVSLEHSSTTGCESFPARTASGRAALWPEVVGR